MPEPEATINRDPEYAKKIEKELSERNEQFYELQIEHNKLKEEFEAMRLQLKEIQSQGYPELKLAYSEVKERAQEMADEKRIYYNKWYATLTKEEQKEEDSRRFNEGACRSENNMGKTCYEREYEKIVNALRAPVYSVINNIDDVNFIEDSDEESEAPPPPPPAPAPVKSILSIIDDSDEEGDGEVETVRIKDNKIMSALECECEFVE